MGAQSALWPNPGALPSRWTFINHGAFGGVLRCAALEAEAWRRRCEAQPLLFLDRWGGLGPEVLPGTAPADPRFTLPEPVERAPATTDRSLSSQAGSCFPSWCG